MAFPCGPPPFVLQRDSGARPARGRPTRGRGALAAPLFARRGEGSAAERAGAAAFAPAGRRGFAHCGPSSGAERCDASNNGPNSRSDLGAPGSRCPSAGAAVTCVRGEGVRVPPWWALLSAPRRARLVCVAHRCACCDDPDKEAASGPCRQVVETRPERAGARWRAQQAGARWPSARVSGRFVSSGTNCGRESTATRVSSPVRFAFSYCAALSGTEHRYGTIGVCWAPFSPLVCRDLPRADQPRRF